jgi:hypothetical protein
MNQKVETNIFTHFITGSGVTWVAVLHLYGGPSLTIALLH